MKWTKLNEQEAQVQAQDYPYVLVRELSRVYLGEASQVDIQWDEVTEVRFFDGQSELRIWREEKALTAVRLEDAQEDETTCVEWTYPLAHKGAFGQALTVVEYLQYDEDGQMYRAATRLKGWVK